MTKKNYRISQKRKMKINEFKMNFKIIEKIKCRKNTVLLSAIIILTFIFVIVNLEKKTKDHSSISVTKKIKIGNTKIKNTKHINHSNNNKNDDNKKKFTGQNTRHFKQDKEMENKIIMSKRPKIKVWKDAPDLTIMCRTYSGGIMEYYNTFLVGYHLFWPKEQWPNSDLVVVLDDENELDHRLGTVLANLPPYPKVYFEKIPEEETFCPENRGLGYSRQQYSNFYSDLYTDNEYIGIIDSDSVLATYVVPENLFVNGKPRILGYVTHSFFLFFFLFSYTFLKIRIIKL